MDFEEEKGTARSLLREDKVATAMETPPPHDFKPNNEPIRQEVEFESTDTLMSQVVELKN